MRRRQVVVNRVVGRVPIVPVGLDEHAQPLRRLIVDLDRAQVLDARIEVLGHPIGLGEIHIRPGARIGALQPQLAGGVPGVLSADGIDLIAAFAVGRGGLVVLVAESLVALRLVGRAEGHVLAWAKGAGDIAVGVAAAIAVGRQQDRPGQHIRIGLGHHIDRPGHRLGAIEQRLAALQHLDPVDHAAGQGVERGGAGIEAVIDAHPVHQPQHVGGARAHQREVHIVEGAVLGQDEQARSQGLQGAGQVRIAALANLGALDDIDLHAGAGQLFGQGVFQRPRGDHHLASIARGLGLGAGDENAAGQGGSRQQDE